MWFVYDEIYTFPMCLSEEFFGDTYVLFKFSPD